MSSQVLDYLLDFTHTEYKIFILFVLRQIQKSQKPDNTLVNVKIRLFMRF